MFLSCFDSRNGYVVKAVSRLTLFFVFGLFSSLAVAKTYYISANGNDGNRGTSTSAPWKTISSAMWKIGAGDKVLLRRGDVFYETNSVIIAFSNVTLGAYGEGNRPVISGSSFTEPGGHYASLVMIGNGDGTVGHNSTVENIVLTESSGSGLTITADNARVDNVLVDQTVTGGIVIQSDSYGAVVENSEVKNHNLAWKNGESYYEDLGLGKMTWSIGIASKGEDFIIRNNHVHHGWGEGIGVNCGARNGLIEGNTIDSNKIGVYLDIAQNIVVKDNIITGATDKTYWRSKNNIGQGIGINHETWCSKLAVNRGRHAYNDSFEIVNNKVSGTSTGFFIWSQVSDATIKSVNLSCNSFLNNQYPLEAGENVSISQFSITNNNFLALFGDGLNPVEFFPVTQGFSFSENAWYPAPAIALVKSALDSYAKAEKEFSACGSMATQATSPPLPPSSIVVETFVQ